MSDAWTNWHGDPDELVHVKFRDGTNDAHLPPSPARNLGLAGGPSNWRWSNRDMNSVVAFRRASTTDDHLRAVMAEGQS